MPDDRDRLLAQLAVEGGFLSRDEAGRYWQRLLAPGAPRLGQLLLQEGRLSQADLEVLRRRFLEAQQAAPQPQPQPPQPQQPPAPAPASFAGAEDWDQALEKDALLARVLLSRGLTTQDRLRECRQLQLQHRMRLGVVLVKKGYVDKGAVEQAIAVVRERMGSGAAARPQPSPPLAPTVRSPTGAFAPPPDHDEAPTLMEPPGGVAALANPFASVRTPRPARPPQPGYDQVPTLLDADPGRLAAAAPRPAGDLQDDISTLMQGRTPLAPHAQGHAQRAPGLPAGMALSTEELNPFADLPPAGGPASSFTDIPMPGAQAPLASPFAQPTAPPVQHSVDELDAFASVPLGPPPSPGAEQPLQGTVAPSYFHGPQGGQDTVPPTYKASGLTPTGVPVGGTADSDSANVKAPRKKRRGAVAASSGTGSGSNRTVILAIGGALVGVALAAVIIFLFVL